MAVVDIIGEEEGTHNQNDTYLMKPSLVFPPQDAPRNIRMTTKLSVLHVSPADMKLVSYKIGPLCCQECCSDVCLLASLCRFQPFRAFLTQ